MPKGPKNKATFKLSSQHIALLLVKIILIKIGSIPLSLLRTFQKAIRPRRRLAGRPKKFRLSKKSQIIIAVTIILLFLFSYTFFLLTAAYQLPTPTRLSSPNEPLTTEIYDRNGTLLYRFYEGKNRTLVKLSDVPQYFIKATIAAEDQNFYRHFGIDPIAIVRALITNYQTGSQEGASTLTQQLIKNSLLTPEKSYTRKVREAILALWAERIYSKDEILQMYLNEAPYGGATVGIAAAAQTYFGKSPADLTLAESSYLAGLPVSPTQFSPYGKEPQLAKQRQKEVLTRMVEDKYITASEANSAFKENLNIKPLVNSILAPHFVFYIRDLLSEKYGPKVVSQGGLRIYTTLDLKIQEEAEKIVSTEIDGLASLNVNNGAAMVMDAKSGQILAMVGSRDYRYPGFGNFNVTLSARQPGSSIKPLTYAAAFKKGFNPDSIVLDTPVTFKDEWGNGYTPVNYDGRYHGPVTIRQALGSSLNIPAVKLLATVGIEPVAQLGKDMGITSFNSPERFGLSLTLGSAEVKMIEMMGVYDTFSQQGTFTPPVGILKVTDSQGYILEEYQNLKKEVLSPQIAYLITNILSDDNARKMAFGANSLLNIPGYEVAVKTGTSDNKRDNWTFGFTPRFVVGVWVGNPDNSPMNPNLASGITGAAPIWNKIMHALLEGTEPLSFAKPSNIAQAQTYTIPKNMVKVQKNKDQLIFSDVFSSYATSSAQANLALPNL